MTYNFVDPNPSAPKGILQLDNVRIIYRNFAGVGSKFNREGDRNFAIVIDDPNIAKDLKDRGWNVRAKEGRREDDGMFYYLPVKIKFNGNGPNVFLKTGSSMNKLTESTVCLIDDIDIASVSCDLRPYDWDVNGRNGRTAYLASACITQVDDRFLDEYNRYSV